MNAWRLVVVERRCDHLSSDVEAARVCGHGDSTLALGIGTNTAIFTVVDSVILRATPFPDPDRLVVLWETNPALPVPVMVASPPTLYDWTTRHRSFEAVGAFRWRSVTLGGGEPEQVRGATMTASLLRALAVQPAMGRWFLDEEDRPNARPVVLLGEALWRRRFAADPGVLGRSLLVDGVGHEMSASCRRRTPHRRRWCFAASRPPIAPSCGCRSRLIWRAVSAPRITSPSLPGSAVAPP